jgi:hypothetical protein
VTQPQRVPWPVKTLRSPAGDLYIAVDSLMDFRNKMTPAGWPPIICDVLDHIIREAQRTDIYGEDVT